MYCENIVSAKFFHELETLLTIRFIEYADS